MRWLGILTVCALASCVGRTQVFRVPSGELVVEALYPDHPDWNDYVASGHAGEARIVHFSGRAACDGVTATDALGAFTWSCGVTDTGIALTTTALAKGKGLRDLVTEAGFRANAVTIRAGSEELAHTVPAVWGWRNAVEVTPTGQAATLDTPGTIYVVTSSAATNGYTLAANGVSLVTLGDAELALSDGAASCLVCADRRSFLWVETASSGNVTLSNVSFSRLNAITVHDVAHAGVTLDASSFNTATGVDVRNSGGSAVVLSNGSTWNVIDGVTAVDVGIADVVEGVLVTNPGTSFNKLHAIRVVNAGTYGIRIYDDAHDNWILSYESHAQNGAADDVGIGVQGPRNHIVGGTVTNNIGWGVRIQFWLGGTAVDTTIVGLLATSNENTGVYLQDQATRSTMLNVTTVQNTVEGVGVLSSHDTTLVNILGVANGADGVALYGNDTDGPLVANNVRDVMALDNSPAGGGFQLISSIGAAGQGDQNRFDGDVWVNGATPCYSNTAVSGSGLVDGTCTTDGLDGSSSYGSELSTAVLHLVGSAASTFVGAVTRDDAASTIDAAGTAAAASLFGNERLSLENPWRAWGKDATFLTQAGIGRCASGTCRIWDWRLSASDTLARARFGVFSPGAPCPAAAHGDVVADDRQQGQWFPGIVGIEQPASGDNDGVCESGELCFNRFLIHATEIVMDGVGDDDGLCESSEACIFAPNLGAYQGEGDYSASTCVFTDGGPTGVHGVTLYGYPQNGG